MYISHPLLTLDICKTQLLGSAARYHKETIHAPCYYGGRVALVEQAMLIEKTCPAPFVD